MEMDGSRRARDPVVAGVALVVLLAALYLGAYYTLLDPMTLTFYPGGTAETARAARRRCASSAQRTRSTGGSGAITGKPRSSRSARS